MIVIENHAGADISCHYFYIKCNPRQFLARRKAKSGYEIEICPHHQILACRSFYTGAKPFMKWTPGAKNWGIVYYKMSYWEHNIKLGWFC